jgi:hypothetical protein
MIRQSETKSSAAQKKNRATYGEVCASYREIARRARSKGCDLSAHFGPDPMTIDDAGYSSPIPPVAAVGVLLEAQAEFMALMCAPGGDIGKILFRAGADEISTAKAGELIADVIRRVGRGE